MILPVQKLDLPVQDRRMAVVCLEAGEFKGWFIADGIQDAIARAASVGRQDLADALASLPAPESGKGKIELLGGKYVVFLD